MMKVFEKNKGKGAARETLVEKPELAKKIVDALMANRQGVVQS